MVCSAQRAHRTPSHTPPRSVTYFDGDELGPLKVLAQIAHAVVAFAKHTDWFVSFRPVLHGPRVQTLESEPTTKKMERKKKKKKKKKKKLKTEKKRIPTSKGYLERFF
jgi:hypothetical protein